MSDNFKSFESLLIEQSNILTASKPHEFNKTFKIVATQALEWFNLDRLSLFPNSMILLNEGKTISVARTEIPDLQKQRFIKGNYKDYLNLLKSKEPWQTFADNYLKAHKLDVIKELYAEGVKWHGIVSLQLFGQTWGALTFSRFNSEGSKLSQEDMARLKLLSDIWLCYWQHTIISRSLQADTQQINNEDEKLLLLSTKQCSVLSLLAQGLTAKQCADKLFLSSRTIESHKYRMLDILNLDNHNELIQFALRNGFGIKD